MWILSKFKRDIVICFYAKIYSDIIEYYKDKSFIIIFYIYIVILLNIPKLH